MINCTLEPFVVLSVLSVVGISVAIYATSQMQAILHYFFLLYPITHEKGQVALKIR